MKTSKKRTPQQDVIVFLHSMLELIERRGLRHVHEQFGQAMTGMANAILEPESFDRAGRHSEVINAAAGFVEEFPAPRGVPVSVVKAMMMVIEEALQEPDGKQPTPAAQEVTQ